MASLFTANGAHFVALRYAAVWKIFNTDFQTLFAETLSLYATNVIALMLLLLINKQHLDRENDCLLILFRLDLSFVMLIYIYIYSFVRI